MATFELTAPDGGTYHVDAPDEHAAADALGKILGGSKAADTPAQAAPAAPQQGMLERIRDAIHAPTRALENGVLFGLGDRARAGMDAGTEALSGKGFNYSDNLKNEQGETEQFAKDHPVASPVLGVVGGAAAPVGAFAAAAKAATLGGKILAGGAAGGTVGGIQGALASKDYTDPTQVGKDAAFGGAAGLVLGGAVPAAGRAIGAGYNAAANAVRGRVEGMSRAAGNHMVSAMDADGIPAIQAQLQALGKDAMLADAGEGMLATAQGAALNSLEGRANLFGPLRARDAATNDRMMGDVNKALGPAEDPVTVTNAIKARRAAVDGVNYPAALDNAPAVKTAPIMRDLFDRIDQAPVGSMEHKALSSLQKMLTKTEREPMLDGGGFQVYDRLGNEKYMDVPYSHDSASVLHKVKGELDNVIEHDAPGLGVPAGALSRQQTALKQMRFAINDALETQVPGYAAANRQSAALAKRGEAVELGTQYLGSGKTTPSPDRFAAAFDPLLQGEKIAFAKGSRGEIERNLGVKANDLQALRGELQGTGGWNTAKIATVHGQPAADELVGTVNRNLKFRDTFTKVSEGAQTDIRNAIRKEMKPDPSTETALINPNMSLTGLLATGAKKVGNAALSAVRPDPTRSYGEVAKILTEQGPARDARVQAIADALNRRNGNAAVSTDVGNRTSLLAAIAANGAANSRRRNQQ